MTGLPTAGPIPSTPAINGLTSAIVTSTTGKNHSHILNKKVIKKGGKL